MSVPEIVPITNQQNAVIKSKHFQHRTKEENRIDEISKETARKFMGIFDT